MHISTRSQGLMAHLIYLSAMKALLNERMLSGADALGSGCSREWMPLIGSERSHEKWERM